MLQRTPPGLLLNYVLVIVLILLAIKPEATTSTSVYPDGGRNVIPLVRPAKPQNKHRSYNDGTVMAHVIGSAGMNFYYYFHVLGVACENADPDYYKIIQKDFEYCFKKIGPLPQNLRKQPLGSIQKPCVDWEQHDVCYQNLAEDYDECLYNRPGLAKKGTDAWKFTRAYKRFICGNIQDTEAHLLDRYTKRDLLVNGVFQCFPTLQDRIVNCVKRDKVSKTICEKFYVVHACFGKYYNDDNCADVQPIYYMDELFRNMTASMNCPKNPWPGGGQTPPTSYPPQQPTTEGNGWTSRENPGRPWSGDTDRERFWSWNNAKDQPSFISRVQPNQKFNFPQNPNNQYQVVQQQFYPGSGRGKSTYMTPNSGTHSNRPFPDRNWNNNDDKPWVDILDRGRGSTGQTPWEPSQSNYNNGRGGQRGQAPVPDIFVSSRPGFNRGGGSYSNNQGQGRYVTIEKRPEGWVTATLPPAGFAQTRSSSRNDASERDIVNTRGGLSSIETDNQPSNTGNNDEGYNFYSFE